MLIQEREREGEGGGNRGERRKRDEEGIGRRSGQEGNAERGGCLAPGCQAWTLGTKRGVWSAHTVLSPEGSSQPLEVAQDQGSRGASLTH